MGFRDARTKVIQRLKEGSVQHEARDNIDEKNLLATGEVSEAEVIDALKACRGTQHESDEHHVAPETQVEIFTPRQAGFNWYIKCYFLKPDLWFISVHRKKTQPRKKK